MQITNQTKGLFFAILTASMWGFLAIVMKVALTNIDPITVTWFRFTIAFTCLATWLLITMRNSFNIIRKAPIMLVVAAVALGLNYLGFISGINLTSPNIAQVFIQFGPLILALSGFTIYKEKLTWLKLAGFILVITGFWLFYKEQLAFIQHSSDVFNKGVLWVIFGALMWSVYAILQKKLVQTYPPMQLNLVLFGLPALGFLPFIDYTVFSTATSLEWLLLLVLGLNTLIAYGAIGVALKYLEANRVSVIITFNPVITFVTMAILAELQVRWIVKEHYSPTIIVGAGLALLGVLLANLPSRKKQKIS